MGNIWFIQGVICILFKGEVSQYMEDYYGLLWILEIKAHSVFRKPLLLETSLGDRNKHR